MQHRDALGQAQDHLHVVFHHEDRGTGRMDLFDQCHEFRHLLDRHARHWLIEQQNLRWTRRLAREKDREFELAFAAVRKGSGSVGRVGGQAGAGQCIGGRGTSLRTDAAPRLETAVRSTDRRLRCQFGVLGNGEPGQHARRLERPSEAVAHAAVHGQRGHVASVHLDAACTRPGEPGDQVEKRGFACPVRPDDGQQFTRSDAEIDVFEYRAAAHAPTEAGQREDAAGERVQAHREPEADQAGVVGSGGAI